MVREGPWRGLGAPARFRRRPGGTLEKGQTLFLLDVDLRWLCQRSKLILMFSVLGRFVKRSVVSGSWQLFHVFVNRFCEACIVAKQ